MTTTTPMHLKSLESDQSQGSISKVELGYTNFRDGLANPAPVAMGAFATTLLTVSLAMMGLRGVSNQALFAGDLCFVACVALLISAQWEMVRGQTFSYTVLTAFGLFYGSYGFLLLPTLGFVEAYGGYTPEYYNAMGFFILLWAVFTIFFLIASCAFNFVYICLFISVELCLVLDASAQFTMADGNRHTSNALMTAAGVWAFIASVLGYYTVLAYLCQDVLPFQVPLGDTSHVFKRIKGRRRQE